MKSFRYDDDVNKDINRTIIRNVLAVSKDYDAALVKREAMCVSVLVAMHLSCSN